MCSIYILRFQQTEKHKYRTEHSAGLKLLSCALSDRYSIDIPEDALTDAIRTGTYGKPELVSYPEIHFNISHCDDMAVCALSDQEIGVDIENIKPFQDVILRKVLAGEEKDFLQQMSIDEASHQEWFFRIWTLKESRIKHSGMGLSMPLTDFSFQYDLNTDPYKIYCSDSDLYFHQYVLEEQYILSVCTSVPETVPQLIYV